jgi:predicted HTH domain antitoxin
VSLVIPDDILRATHMSSEELRLEVAVMLFAKKRLTLGKAARLAEMSQRNFQHLLGKRKISPHYGVKDFRKDLQTLEELDTA